MSSFNNASAFNQDTSQTPSMASLSSSAGIAPSLSREQWKERLTRFYNHYNPSCVSTVDGLLDKYKNNESALLRVLIKRWGPEPAAAAASPSPAKNESQNDTTTISAAVSAASPLSTSSTATSSAASPPKAQTTNPPAPLPSSSSASAVTTSTTTTPAPAATTTNEMPPPQSSSTSVFGSGEPTTTTTGLLTINIDEAIDMANNTAADSRSRGSSVASSPTSTTASSSLAASSSGSSKLPPPHDPKWTAIILAFLRKYAPSQVDQINIIMSKAKGKEKQALFQMQKQYEAKQLQQQQQQTQQQRIQELQLQKIQREQVKQQQQQQTMMKPSATPSATSGRTTPQLQQQQSANNSNGSHTTSPTSRQPPSSLTPPRSERVSIAGGSTPTTRTDAAFPTTSANINTTVASDNATTTTRRSSITPTSASSEAFYRRRIIRMYEHYRPDKLADIEKIFTDPKYANRDFLLQVLVKKYGQEPVSQPLPGDDWKPPVARPEYPHSTIIPWPVRFFYMFLMYDDSKIPELPRLIEANSGHEGRWMSVLTREYGNEPEQPANYQEDPDVDNDPQVARFVQKLSSVFSQFSPQMLPVVRAMAKERSMLSRLDEITNAARDYYLASLDPTNNNITSRGVGSVSPYRNNNNSHFGSFATSAGGSPNSRYFDNSSPSGANSPRDLVQQAVDLVQQNKLLMQLQEPSDADLINRSTGRMRNNNNRSGLYGEASHLLQQAPYSQNRRSASATSTGSYNNNNNKLNNYRGNKSRGMMRSGDAMTMELRAKNQQLEEMVGHLTTALDTKTNELKDVVGSRSTSAGSSLGLQQQQIRAASEKRPATTQTFFKARINHATQTAAIISSDGPASSVEEELENVRSNLSVKEHQNRMLRLQLQQYAQELSQKERQLKNSLSCVDSLTETVNMRMRENATLKLERVPTSDPDRFLEVVDEIKQAFQLHYKDAKERDESEMNDYYTLANQMIKHRDESIQELTKALEGALDERKRLVAAANAASILETEGEVFRDPTMMGSGGENNSPSNINNSNNSPTSADAAANAAAKTMQVRSHLEKKVSRLEKELARANTQIQAQNDEHTTLVNALALYSSTGREASANALSSAFSPGLNKSSGAGSSSFVAGNLNKSSFAPSDTDPFAALLSARQKNASETPSIGVSKDEHLSRIEQLDSARLEAESAKAALAAELHRRSVALEENEKQRVEVERHLEKMQEEMNINQQELTYWRNEAETRKKDCNRLVEHVATLSEALQQQKEKISSGGYLLSHSSNNLNSSNVNDDRRTLYNFDEAPDESEPERKIVSTYRLPSTTNSNLNNNNNSSRAASLSTTRQQWNNSNQQNSNSSPAPLHHNGNGKTISSMQRDRDNNNNNYNNSTSTYTKSNLWSMMYGEDQDRVDQAEEQYRGGNPNQHQHQVNPYPMTKGYHFEDVNNQNYNNNEQLRSASTSSGKGPMLNNAYVNKYFGDNSTNPTSKSDLPSSGFLGYRAPKHNNNNDQNLSAAASVALARANIASTSGGIL